MNDPSARLRGLTESRLSRRTVLGGIAGGAGLIGISTLLSACGIRGSGGRTAENVDWKKYWSAQHRTGQLSFANWPLYIDEKHGSSHSLALFRQATGITVDYQPVIQSNESFYATEAPVLRARESTGFDLIVMSNGWELTEMIRNGFVVELDHTRLPNLARYAAPSVLNPTYDPGNRHSVVYQTGFTGIAYNEKLTGRPITSFADLRDPAFAGHIGMMSENTELGSAALLALGIPPVDSTPKHWRRAARWLRDQRPLVAGYYDQSYIDKLQNGDIWITQAWSGDVFQANAAGNTEVKFVTPREGQLVWHDNMLIPRQAAHPVDALEWMNFYYTPKIAGIVADWVNYICPVPEAKQYIAETLGNTAVADSPLVFPDRSIESRSHEFYVFKNYDEYALWNEIFNPIVQS